MEKTAQNIIEVQIALVDARGERAEGVIFIAEPYCAEPGEWHCRAGVFGLDEVQREAIGSDSLQALCLAMRRIKNRLQAFVDIGGSLYRTRDRWGRPKDEFFSVADYFVT